MQEYIIRHIPILTRSQQCADNQAAAERVQAVAQNHVCICIGEAEDLDQDAAEYDRLQGPQQGQTAGEGQPRLLIRFPEIGECGVESPSIHHVGGIQR